MDHPEGYLGRLKPIYIFKGLSDPDLLEVAEALEVEHYPAGEVLFEQGDEGENFYILNKGRVKVLHQGRGGKPVEVATLVPGDFFGEGALIHRRRRSATIKAETDIEVLTLSKEDLDDLLRRFPHLKANLELSFQSHELSHWYKFNWLGPNEVVYLIARRHVLLLLQRLFFPVVAFALIALAAVWLAVIFEQMWIAWAGALLELPVALWMLWVRIDWANDLYVVTNQRLVHMEKIVGIYDSRVEAPLTSIMSVNVQTEDVVQRAVDMGDVVVRTFSGPIVLNAAANPTALAAAIEEHWNRTRTHEREAQIEEMRQVIRNRLESGKPPSPNKPKPVVKTEAQKSKPLLQRLGEFFSLRVRYEQGGNVVYRKHWFVLAQRIWQPTLAILALLAVVTVAAAGFLPSGIGLGLVLLVAFVIFIPLALWWLYEYVDWHNEIYMVTADQILAIHKKPLGQETKKAAPLGNILSLRLERPGLLGLLLNYGNVVAQVAAADFVFEGVFDPAGVQNDVYRRMEAFNHRRSQAEAARRRDELVDWLTVYHRLHHELQAEDKDPFQHPGEPPADSQ